MKKPLSVASNVAASEPEILKRLGEASVRRGTDKLTTRQIDRAIKAARAKRRRARR